MNPNGLLFTDSEFEEDSWNLEQPAYNAYIFTSIDIFIQ
jgi:hypothetical protein